MSLAELLAALTVLGLAMSTVAPALHHALAAWADTAARVETQQATRVALERLAHDVRGAGFGGDGFAAVAAAEPERIVLQYDLDGDGAIAGAGETITWRLAGAVLRRDAGGGAQPVVNGVRALRFTYLDGGGGVTAEPADVRAVQVDLTAGSARPASPAGMVSVVSTLVRLRNR